MIMGFLHDRMLKGIRYQSWEVHDCFSDFDTSEEYSLDESITTTALGPRNKLLEWDAESRKRSHASAGFDTPL